MSRRFVFGVLLVAWSALPAAGQEHRVEVIKAPEAEGLSDDVAATLSDEGFKVVRGSSRTVCEIWPCKQWDHQADFKPSSQRLYPFESGQLLGLLHFRRRGKDFRDQTISSGWYTLRYGLQPTDGNHEGTSPTRDFLLMVRCEDDQSPEPMPEKQLLEASAEAAGSAHPAMLCLQRSIKDASKVPSMRYVEDRDWWILQFTGKATAGGNKEPKDLPVAVIVVGHAEE